MLMRGVSSSAEAISSASTGLMAANSHSRASERFRTPWNRSSSYPSAQLCSGPTPSRTREGSRRGASEDVAIAYAPATQLNANTLTPEHQNLSIITEKSSVENSADREGVVSPRAA